MKVYVASSWRNDDQPQVVSTLRRAGHEVYDFRNPSMGPGDRGQGFHWSDIDPEWKEWTPSQFRAALGHEVAVDGFASDLCGMEWADAFVLVMPCGRSAHLELGWAIGAGKPAIILLSDGEPELMYGLADHLCVSLAGVLGALQTYSDGLPGPPVVARHNNDAVAHVLQFFEYAHLPLHLQEISKAFHVHAHWLARAVPAGPELTVALRKLLEAKDAAVRANLASGGKG